MSMPETAVYKNSDALLGENKIWFAEERKVSPPASDSRFVEKMNKAQFCVPIAARANPRHNHRSFFRREKIGHRYAVLWNR